MKRVKPSVLVQKLLHLRGEPFNIADYPYFDAIYNTQAREVGLWTGRQVAKSSFLASDAVLYAVTHARTNQVIVSPLQEQAYVFATERLRDFIHDSPIIKHNFFTGPTIVDQLLRKQFNNGSMISLGYASRSADRLRGRSAERVKFDESIRGSTCVATPSGPCAIKDLHEGDEVWSFDVLSGQIVRDTVQTVYDHGIRQVWRVTLEDGSVLDCTSGTRLFGPDGWVYLHEVIDYATHCRSADSREFQETTELRAEAASSGDDARGRVFLQGSVSGIPGGEADRVCGPQVRDTQGLREHAATDVGEPWVGGLHPAFRRPEIPRLRVFADPLLPSGPVEPIPDEEDGDAGVARRSGLDGDRVLVHGRRVPVELAFSDYLDTRFFETRERPSGLVVVLERDRNGGLSCQSPWRREVVSSDEPRTFLAVHREGEAVYSFLSDVQDGDRPPGGASLRLLRGRVPTKEHPIRDAVSMLRLRGVPGRVARVDADGVYGIPHPRGTGAPHRKEERKESGTLCNDDTADAGACSKKAGGLEREESGQHPSLATRAPSVVEGGPGGAGETSSRAGPGLRAEEGGPRSPRPHERTTADSAETSRREREGTGTIEAVAGEKPRQARRTACPPEYQAMQGSRPGWCAATSLGSGTSLDTAVACLDEGATGGRLDLYEGYEQPQRLHPSAEPGVPGGREGENPTKPRKAGQGILSVEFLGYDRVYDIETEKHHNFFANGVLIHNCQDIMPEVIPVIKEMTFRVAEPSVWYCGTPKTMSNHMEGMRARSTGCEWAVRCLATGCKKWNITWDEHNIGHTGVICAHCGAPLNTNLGQWVARRHLDIHRGRESMVNMESYRIPQLIVKPIMDNPNKWLELLAKLRDYPTYQFYNEVLGLPYDSGQQPVTLEQLARCCDTTRHNVPPDPRNPVYPPLVMGVDWAFTAESSYTFVVIGGWNPYPHKFEVYYWKKYKGTESDSLFQIQDIIKMFRGHNIKLIGADWGAGHVQNLKLVEALGEESVAQMWHTGMKAKSVGGGSRAKWEPKSRKWHLARTRVLTDTYETIRREQMVFPRMEECGPFFDDLLAEALEYSENTNQVFYTHINPDDGLHALTFAMLAGELLLRGDFGGHAGSDSIVPGAGRDHDHGDGWNDDTWGVGDDFY